MLNNKSLKSTIIWSELWGKGEILHDRETGERYFIEDPENKYVSVLIALEIQRNLVLKSKIINEAIKNLDSFNLVV